MKHIAQIQSEFIKEARKWEKLSLKQQKAYLRRHPKSKRQLTNFFGRGGGSGRTSMPDFEKGQKVRLKANKKEGWPAEAGKIVDVEEEHGVIMVRVDKKYRDKGDDGLREVTPEQIEE